MTDVQQPVPFVDLARMHDPLRPELDAVLAESVDRGDFILGEAVERFEHAFADYCEVDHAIGVDSGTSALELALRALDIGPGDEVITAANTFIATALAIHHVGATPVLVDVDPASFNIDPGLVERAITSRTRAVIPVHLYGRPADMDPIVSLARTHDLYVIEDASQAHGARFAGRRVGGLGDLAAFSLYPAKNLGAFGDAGVLTTNDAGVAERLRLLRNYGSPTKYLHPIPGFNRRLDTLQARVLLVKLRHLDAWNRSRRSSAAYYRARLENVAVKAPMEDDRMESVFHLFVIQTTERDHLKNHLDRHSIGTVIHYPVPIHLQESFGYLGMGHGSYPVTERLAESILSIPMFPGLRRSEQDRVVSAIDSFIGARGAAAS